MPDLDPVAQDLLEAAITLAVFISIAVVTRFVTHLLARRFGNQGNEWRAVLAKSLGGIAMWGLALSGIALALRGLDQLKDRPMLSYWIGAALGVSWVTIVVVAAVRFINAYFYSLDRAAAGDTANRSRTTLLRKLSVGIVLVIGILLAMRIGGFDIGPLLAGGAIGGVILGLALQGSLSNVFAGLLLTLDGNLRVGEMIRFTDGTTATLENIGWRSASFRLLDSTILVLPNNEFSREKFINLSRPTPITSLYFDCGVAYSENLETVEEVALEAAASVQAEIAGETKLAAPTLRWRFFGDGAVMFRLYMEVPHPHLQSRALSELLKRLHERLTQAGISIQVKAHP